MRFSGLVVALQASGQSANESTETNEAKNVEESNEQARVSLLFSRYYPASIN